MVEGVEVNAAGNGTKGVLDGCCKPAMLKRGSIVHAVCVTAVLEKGFLDDNAYPSGLGFVAQVFHGKCIIYLSVSNTYATF